MLPPADSEVVEIAIIPDWKLAPVPLPSDNVVVPVPSGAGTGPAAAACSGAGPAAAKIPAAAAASEQRRSWRTLSTIICACRSSSLDKCRRQ